MRNKSYLPSQGKILMKLFITGIAVILLICSCYTPETEEEFKTDEKITKLIADVYIMQVLLDKADIKYKDSLKQVYTDELCALHRITEKQLTEVLDKLASRGDTLLKHQTNAMDTLRFWQDEANRLLSTGLIINN